MKKYFITYGDGLYCATRDRLCKEAEATGVFDVVIGYGPEDLTPELLNSPVYTSGVKGGYWSWKADIVFQTVDKMSDGDILFYVDAGSTVVPGQEWKWYFKKLEKYELIAQRIYLSTGAWTRRSLIDVFPDNGVWWRQRRQFTSNVVILRKSDFTIRFAHAWRSGMIEHPEWVMDVPAADIQKEYSEFVENRYDQSVYSALVYHALNDKTTKAKVLAKWEHVEDIDPIRSQVIQITRLRFNQRLDRKRILKLYVRRVIKDYIRKPLFYFCAHSPWSKCRI